MTISAIAGNTGAVIPLDLPNRGTLPFLDDRGHHRGAVRGRRQRAARPAGGQGAGPRPRAHHLREGVRAGHGEGGDERRGATTASTRWRMNPLVHSRPLAESLVDALLPS